MTAEELETCWYCHAEIYVRPCWWCGEENKSPPLNDKIAGIVIEINEDYYRKHSTQ